MKKSTRIIGFLFAILSLQSFTLEYTSIETTVYICVTGKVYHATRDCRGLANATHAIKAVSLSEAQKTRRPCKICY